MPDEYETDELTEGADVEEGSESEQPETAQASPQQLLAGKYKSVEDLEAAYKELERAFHESRSQQSPATQNYTAAQASTDWREQYEQKFWEDPISAQEQFYQARRSLERMAETNRRLALASLRNDKLFADVAPDVEAELLMLDDSLFYDAHAAQEVVRRIYDQKVGQLARAVLSEGPTTDSRVMALRRQYEVESPDRETDAGPSIGPEAESVLAELPLRNRKAALERIKQRLKQET